MPKIICEIVRSYTRKRMAVWIYIENMSNSGNAHTVPQIDKGDYSMQWCGILGAFHGFIGSSLLFLSLHPLRDALDAHSLELLRFGSGLEAIQGLLCLALYTQLNYRWGVRLIAVGTTIWCSMLYYIVFTSHHPLDLAVPIGGLIMMMGWIALLISVIRKT